MKQKRNILAIIGILIIFAIGAVGYWIFSSELPDGLERTMEDAGVTEDSAAYQAPLSYGDNYLDYLLMGLVGFTSVLAIAFVMGKLMAKKNGA